MKTFDHHKPWNAGSAAAMALAAALFLSLPSAACTTCMGAPDAAQTQGMNAAILTMLGVTVTVLGGVGFAIGGFVYRVQRYDEYGNPIADHDEDPA